MRRNGRIPLIRLRSCSFLRVLRRVVRRLVVHRNHVPFHPRLHDPERGTVAEPMLSPRARLVDLR